MICVHSEDSDQPGHPLSLISLHCPQEETIDPWLPTECTGKTLIRLGGCPGLPESSLGILVILLVVSCSGSNKNITNQPAPGFVFTDLLNSFMSGVCAYTYEPSHDKTNKMACAPSENSDQPEHPPSLITVRSMGSQGSIDSSFEQRRLISLGGCLG